MTQIGNLLCTLIEYDGSPKNTLGGVFKFSRRWVDLQLYKDGYVRAYIIKDRDYEEAKPLEEL